MGYIYENLTKWENAKQYLEVLKNTKGKELSYKYLKDVMEEFEREGSLTQEKHFAIFVANKSWMEEGIR